MMNLFKSKIVPSGIDAGWNAGLPQLAGLEVRPMLVVSLPFGADTREETTLVNMLKACGFGMDAVNVVQLKNDEALPWWRLRDVAVPQYVLLLGINPARLSIEARLPGGYPVEFGGATFILTYPLQDLTANEAARKSLWSDVLKPLFKGG